MNDEKKWVTRKGGGGEKYGCLGEKGRYLRIQDDDTVLSVPKDDYEYCDPPEEWEEIDTVLSAGENVYPYVYPVYKFSLESDGLMIGMVKFDLPGYRVKSLVVERRKA